MSKEQVVKAAGVKGTTLRLTQMAMLTAISVVLIIFVQLPFPAASYLVYDFADVPILLGAFMFGPLSGMMILTVVSAIQAFMLGGNGIIGFIMHLAASGALVVIASLLYRRWGEDNLLIALSLIIGGLSMTALMIPLNLIFTPILFGMPVEAVKQLILPVLLPFNLLKALFTGGIFFFLHKSLRVVMKKG